MQGKAKLTIAGLTLSNDNCDLAVGIWTERFVNKQDVIVLHFNRRINLPSDTHKTTSLRDFLDQVKIHLKGLEVLKQNVNQDVFISIVKPRLPAEVMLQ